MRRNAQEQQRQNDREYNYFFHADTLLSRIPSTSRHQSAQSERPRWRNHSACQVRGWARMTSSTFLRSSGLVTPKNATPPPPSPSETNPRPSPHTTQHTHPGTASST